MTTITPASGKGASAWQLAALTLLILMALAWLAAVPMPYEQDQMSKAAKIISLADSGKPFSLIVPRDYYRDDMFSFYYFIHGVVHSMLRGNVFKEMNLSAAVAGAAFFCLMALTLQRAYAIPYWLTALMAVNTPLFLNLFSYGNEAAFAMLAVAATLLLLTQPTTLRCLLAGVAFALGLHCRPDTLMLTPLLCAWSFFRSEDQPLWQRLKRCGYFSVTAGICAGVYWLLLIRILRSDLSFSTSFKPLLFASYFFYPFGPPLVLVTLAGVASLLWKKSWTNLLLLLLAVMPVIYYVRLLSSPKYVAMVMVPVWAVAGATLMRWRWPARTAAALLAAALWIFSFTPYGIVPGARGAALILPTDDGWLPTGSYTIFYQRVHAGLYQERYMHEMQEVSRLLRPLQQSPDAQLTGYFNMQCGVYERTINPEFEQVWKNVNWNYYVTPTNQTALMTRTGYMRQNTYNFAAQEKLRAWLAAGKVRAVESTEGNPFPEVIELGDPIADGNDSELGRRILFAVDRSHAIGFGERSQFIAEWNATRWLAVTNIASLPSGTASPAYADSSFVCFTNDVGRGIIYSCFMPPGYFRQDSGRRLYSR